MKSVSRKNNWINSVYIEFFCISVFLILSEITQAAVFTWTGGAGNTNWNDAGNWTGGTGSPGNDDTVLYTGTPSPTAARQNLTISVDKITFGSGSGQNTTTNFSTWNLDKTGTTFIEVESGNSHNNTVNNGRGSSPFIQIMPGNNRVLHNGSGLLTLSGNSVNGNGGFRPRGTGSAPYTLEFAGSGDIAINTNFNLEDNGGRQMNVVSNSTGSVIINTVNTYTGSTVVNNGTLGGNGTIASTLFMNGSSLAPGQGIGTFNAGAGVLWAGSASAEWIFELGAGETADLLNITGDFIKQSGTDFIFDFDGSTETGTFDLVSWSGSTTFVEGDFSYTNLGGGNTGSFQISGNTLQFVAIPEPSTSMVLLASLAGLTLRRRRSA